jgi:hypothetical protein
VRIRSDIEKLFQSAFVANAASIARVGRNREVDARLPAEVGTEPETERAAFAALPSAVLFFAQAVLHAIMSVSAVVERRTDGACPFHAGISQNLPRNRALASFELSRNLAEGLTPCKHSFDGFALVECKMFVI